MRQVALEIPLLGLWLTVTLVAYAVATVFGVRLRALRRRLASALAERNAAASVSAATERLLRLAANDFRDPALTLRGHADALCRGAPDPAGHGAAIASIAGQLLSVADALHDESLPQSRPRVLHPEPLCLGQVLADAIAATDAALAPSRRHWRIAADLDARRLSADRRALNQILVHVLTNAARLSRDGDWIDISCISGPSALTLIVADEGQGLAGLDPAWPEGQPDSRGLGLGLSLARMLMLAHGGALLVESAIGIGTRVSLEFPAEGSVGSTAARAAMKEALLAA
jgi:signal transduction histidine kinase